jgi:hypothetical protein
MRQLFWLTLLFTLLLGSPPSFAGQLNGSRVTFVIPSVAADDGSAGSGSDEGKVYFKIVIQ